MKKFLSVLAAALISVSAFAEPLSHCDQMVAYGYPTAGLADTTKLCRISYVVEHDNRRKVPAYSAELLLKEYSSGHNKRVDAFKADPDLNHDERAELSDYKADYKGQKFDRGHMTPFDDAKWNSAASLQTFYLSNMVPQDQQLNRGQWARLEAWTRGFAAKSIDGVYVITGPVFKGKTPTLGNGVAIPSHVFKVIIDKEKNQGVGFIVPNEDPKEGMSFQNYKVTIDEVEKETGINFTPELKDSRATLKHVIGEEFQ